MEGCSGAFHKTLAYSQYCKRHCKLRRSLPLLRHIHLWAERYSCYLNRHSLSETRWSALFITMNDNSFNKIRLSKQDIRQFNISVLKRGTDIRRTDFLSCSVNFSTIVHPAFPSKSSGMVFIVPLPYLPYVKSKPATACCTLRPIIYWSINCLGEREANTSLNLTTYRTSVPNCSIWFICLQEA